MNKKEQMGSIVEFKEYGANSPLGARLRDDLEFNKGIAQKLEEFWSGLGHEVKFHIKFLPKSNVHTVYTNDLKNGLPFKEPLTPIARKKLVQLPV